MRSMYKPMNNLAYNEVVSLFSHLLSSTYTFHKEMYLVGNTKVCWWKKVGLYNSVFEDHTFSRKVSAKS